MKVKDVCAAGETEACKRVKFTESGSFTGVVTGGVVAGAVLTGSVASGICIAVGVPTAAVGTLVCGLVVVGVGSLATGMAGGMFGEKIGDAIYEQTK